MKSQDDRIAQMTFASVYPLYLSKVKKKGRTQTELNEVITWLTGYNQHGIQQQVDKKATFEEFFNAASLHPNAGLITGVICGYR